MTKQNAAIFILTQNTEVRKTYLKTSLYFLCKNFNEKFQYPVCILHEGDYDSDSQREVILSVRESCRHLITFITLDEDDFTLPQHIDKEKMENCIATNPVPYWRNVKYRMMCRWWIVHMKKYARGYEYIMRLDDDAYIEENINDDLFAWMNTNNLLYASNMVHLDCGICCYGMKEFFENMFPDKNDVLKEMFVQQKIPSKCNHMFRYLLSITHGDNQPVIGDTIELQSPVIYYNNFFITKTEFWDREDVKDTIQKIDESGNIFYYRWGDAPLHTALIVIHAKKSECKRCVFRYTKRMQREAFIDDKKESHSYMPPNYSKTSCIIQDR